MGKSIQELRCDTFKTVLCPTRVCTDIYFSENTGMNFTLQFTVFTLKSDSLALPAPSIFTDTC